MALRPARRIAAHLQPGEREIAKRQDAADDRGQRTEIVEEPPERAPLEGWRIDDALLPARRDGQALADAERASGAEGDGRRICRVPHDRDGMLARARDAGIAREVLESDRFGDGNARFGALDREGPAIAGRVPVEFIEIGEIADLARCAIADRVVVRAARHEPVGGADAHAGTVRQRQQLIGLRFAVEQHALDGEADLHRHAASVFVAGREVAVDAVVDLVALDIEADGLGDAEVAVPLDRDVAHEGKDAIPRSGREERRDEDERRKEEARHPPDLRTRPWAAPRRPRDPRSRRTALRGSRGSARRAPRGRTGSRC